MDESGTSCKKCFGTGKVERDVECPTCLNTGLIGGDENKQCECSGFGLVEYDRCDSCNGKGYRDWVDKIRKPKEEKGRIWK